ncbi:MAG: SRPBCC domain-containing protein [Nakamurella sp.]
MTTITLTRTVAADLDTAFTAWTDPASLAQWWWPQWPDTSYEIDARVGGSYRIESDRVGVGVRGEFTTVDQPTLLNMTWIWLTEGRDAELDGVPVIDTVAVSFTPVEGGTEVEVTYTSVAALDDARQGWNDVLDRLPGSG